MSDSSSTKKSIVDRLYWEGYLALTLGYMCAYSAASFLLLGAIDFFRLLYLSISFPIALFAYHAYRGTLPVSLRRIAVTVLGGVAGMVFGFLSIPAMRLLLGTTVLNSQAGYSIVSASIIICAIIGATLGYRSERPKND